MALRALLTALVLALGLQGVVAAQAPASGAPVPEVATTEHLKVELAPQMDAAVPGSVLYVALRHQIARGWHTYWRNSGDAGLATMIGWTLPEGWSAGEVVWPKPSRHFTGPLMNYVFEGDVYLPVPIQVPADAQPGQTVRLVAEADFLVCAEICIPESARVGLDIPVALTAGPNPEFGQAVSDVLAAAPKPVGLTAAAETAPDGTLHLGVVGDEVKGVDVSNAYFFPYNPALIDHAAPQKAERGPDGLTMILTALPGQDPPQTVEGVLSLGGDRAYVVQASMGPPPAGAAGAAPPVETDPEGAPQGAGAGASGVGGILAAVGLAFLGGLVLNLMPCVFPVLSMKAAALVRHADHPGALRAQGLAFLAGVLAAFLILAGLLIAARAGGQAVGWGFQLQNPGVVAGLALLMLLVGLNLSGVFEVGLSAQGVGAGGPTEGLMGAAFTGALAVVVAAPCTAPFMAGAIGWAMVQPPAATLTVFAALGLGLAAPFVAVSFIPALFRRLPKPGGWMDIVRKVLAFPMYGAAAWLAWVFAVQAGTTALPLLFGAAVAVAFAAWAWGLSQTGAAKLAPRIVAAVAAAVAVPLAVVAAGMSAPAPAAAGTEPAAAGALPSEPWSPDRVAALRAEGRPVFVDFTAAWCVTCQVNERTSLAGSKVADAFDKTGAVYMKADWTNRNAEIANELAAHGRSGVPLYLVYGPSGDPEILPQLLTEGMVVKALERAGA